MPFPHLTPAAIEHLAGRPLLIRVSPRHGCCGGHALLPVAEVGEPRDPDGYRSEEIGGVSCFIDPQLGEDLGAWTIDAYGIGRWKRLQIDGAEGLDPTTHVHRHDA
jgi:hypothetical protein